MFWGGGGGGGLDGDGDGVLGLFVWGWVEGQVGGAR